MNLRGSSLVFSLIVLSFLLISALSVATVSVTARRSSLSSKNSNISFQVADSAAELVLKRIYQVNDKGTPINHIHEIIGTCATNEITGSTDVGTYSAVFYENKGTVASPIFSPISCGEPLWRAKVIKIKFQGTYRETIRAIEVSVAPKNDAVAWWEFNVGVGTVAIDSTSNGNDGTLKNGPSWVPGQVTGNALNFNGTINQYVQTDSGISSLGVADQSYTVSAWIRPAVSSETGDIVHVSTATDGSGWCLSMLMINSGKVQSNSWNSGPSMVTSTTSLLANTWYHIASVWDSSGSGSLKVYVNGASEGSTSQSNYTASGVSDYVTIGAPIASSCSNSTNQGFNGIIDEVRIYDRALSTLEINNLYMNP